MPEPVWRCERCALSLPALHEQDGVAYSREVGGWYCIACTRAVGQIAHILRPSGEGPERRRGSRIARESKAEEDA